MIKKNEMKNLRKKIPTLICTILICASLLPSCSIMFQTHNIPQPITMNSKIGVPSVDAPTTATVISKINGSVYEEGAVSGESSYQAWSYSANSYFVDDLGTKPDRFVSNLEFKVINNVYFLGCGGKAGIKFTADCLELNKK